MKFILLSLLVVVSFVTEASGSRSLHISIKTIEKLKQIGPTQLTSNIRYLGSTDHWHIFSKTETYLSKGYPNDHTVGMKIKFEQLVVENYWILDVNKQNYLINTTRCPASNIIKAKPVPKIVVSAEGEGFCIGSVNEH
ncbi:hypothetical protein [Thalassotalea crassostreae]|uniref:hypothetical protein n=1 Tax=Thalassotalea crassostreae TaxID=1763536 RepID=UPI00083943BA|nr:hypothetical protein [Thalassotalea crassostreae]